MSQNSFDAFMSRAFEELRKAYAGERMEEGDDCVIVFRDAVVVFSMDDERNLDVKAILGEPVMVDEAVTEGLLERGGGEK